MDAPTLFESRRVARDTDVVPAYIPLPGLGLVPVNAYLVHAEQPILVDTGLPLLANQFIGELRKRIELDRLRWIWLTHTDPDHMGALQRLLEDAPHAKLITTFLGFGKLNMMMQLDPERIHLLNPGQALDVGDRTLRALRPPVFDAPETTALFDEQTGAFFSADAFGALLSEPVDEAAAIPAPALAQGAIFWGTVDAPWLHMVDEGALSQALQRIADLSPSVVLSAHLPPAKNMTDKLLEHLAAVRTAPPFVGPDQQALEEMRSGAAAQ